MSGGLVTCRLFSEGQTAQPAIVAASQDFPAAWYARLGLKVVTPYTAADAKVAESRHSGWTLCWCWEWAFICCQTDVPVVTVYYRLGGQKFLEQVLMLLLSRIAVVLMLFEAQQAYLPRADCGGLTYAACAWYVNCDCICAKKIGWLRLKKVGCRWYRRWKPRLSKRSFWLSRCISHG